MPALYNWATTDVKAVENVIASHFIRTYRQELTKARELRKIPANVRALLENCGSRPLLGARSKSPVSDCESMAGSRRSPENERIVKRYHEIETGATRRKKREPVQLPHISNHLLQHTGCTRMAESGMVPKVLQTVMGHSDITVTMRIYKHVDQERMEKEMRKRK